MICTKVTFEGFHLTLFIEYAFILHEIMHVIGEFGLHDQPILEKTTLNGVCRQDEVEPNITTTVIILPSSENQRCHRQQIAIK